MPKKLNRFQSEPSFLGNDIRPVILKDAIMAAHFTNVLLRDAGLLIGASMGDCGHIECVEHLIAAFTEQLREDSLEAFRVMMEARRDEEVKNKSFVSEVAENAILKAMGKGGI